MQKRDAQISADNGLIAKNDLLQTETYLASAKLQKITAQSAVTTASTLLTVSFFILFTLHLWLFLCLLYLIFPFLYSKI